MGTDKLHALATGEDPALALAARCLKVELASARWADASQAAADFPKATFQGARVRIPLTVGHSAALTVHYGLGIILIVRAGPDPIPPSKHTKTRKKA